MQTYSTKEVGKLLDVSPTYIQQLIWKDELDAPQKVGRNYRWAAADIEKASWRLRRRNADDIFGRLTLGFSAPMAVKIEHTKPTTPKEQYCNGKEES